MSVIERAGRRLAEEERQHELGADNRYDLHYWAAYLDGARAQNNVYISMRCDLAQIAGKCEHALRHPDEVTSALNSVVAAASAYGLYERVRE